MFYFLPYEWMKKGNLFLKRFTFMFMYVIWKYFKYGEKPLRKNSLSNKIDLTDD